MWKKAENPAQYSDADPLDIAGMQSVVDDLDSQWYTEDRETQRQAIANAFRAALTSPRQNLKWNSIVYQDLSHIPPEEDDPNVFENAIRDRKAQWDKFGQQTLDTLNENTNNQELIDYGPKVIERYMPGIWQNIRNCAVIGPYIEQLREAAIEDIQRGGDGQHFRDIVMNLNIPGIGPKIAAFVWLLLCPKTSRLATVDVHMMRALGQESESPNSYEHYLELESELDKRRKDMGYEDVPLGMFQWATWDQWRTPGWHQDHSALRPLNPVGWQNIDWAPQQPKPRPSPAIEVPDEQMNIFDQMQDPDQMQTTTNWDRKPWGIIVW